MTKYATCENPPAGAEDPDRRCGTKPRPDHASARPAGARADVNFTKRVVAGPADRVAVEQGNVIRDGMRQTEPFAKPCGGGRDVSSRGRSPFRPTTGS